MSEKAQVQTQIAALQAKLVILNRIPEDTFPFGTILRFAGSNFKWHYMKVEEESWTPLNGGSSTSGSYSLGPHPIDYWVVSALDSNIGYFEIYVLSPAASPIFASS